MWLAGHSSGRQTSTSKPDPGDRDDAGRALINIVHRNRERLFKRPSALIGDADPNGVTILGFKIRRGIYGQCVARN